MGKKSRIRRIKIRKYVFRAFTQKIHYTLNNVMSASVDHMRYEPTCRYISFWILINHKCGNLFNQLRISSFRYFFVLVDLPAVEITSRAIEK